MEKELENNFSLKHTLESGQVFGWKKIGDKYLGELNGNAVCISQSKNNLEFEGTGEKELGNYLRLDEDAKKIEKSILKDEIIKNAVSKFSGLSILRQDPFYCSISYLCSSNCNIPRIEKMLENLRRRKGEKLLEKKEAVIYSFPTPEKLARLSIEELRECNLGFRAKYVKEFATKVAEGQINLKEIKSKSYEEGRELLMQSKGIGEKVADCISLFSLEKLNAFPVDVHIERIMKQNYPQLASEKKQKIGEFARSYFGPYAGYAQEFLFMHSRYKNIP
jgi:N-glycosylase/DNA lyase